MYTDIREMHCILVTFIDSLLCMSPLPLGHEQQQLLPVSCLDVMRCTDAFWIGEYKSAAVEPHQQGIK